MLNKTQIKRIEKIENLRAVVAAAVEYRDLRDRRTDPGGRFDNGGRFFLHCRAGCCIGIRTPSRAHPYSEMVHGRSATHVAGCAGVDAADVRYVAGLIDAGIPANRIPNAAAEAASAAALEAIEAVCA